MIVKKIGGAILLMLLASMVEANTLKSKELRPANHKLMTARDINAYSLSNISLQNKLGTPVTVYALYVPQLSYTSTDCNLATVLYTSTNASGAFLMPVMALLLNPLIEHIRAPLTI